MGRGSVITSSGLDWERFGVITGGDEVCIYHPPLLSEKGVGIPTCVHYPKKKHDQMLFFSHIQRIGCQHKVLLY